MANKDTAKQWFKTGDKPTQAQFYQVFDWLSWKDEGFGIDDIPGLLEALITKADSFTVQNIIARLFPYEANFIADAEYLIKAGVMLDKLVVIPSVELPSFKIGSANGLEDIMPEQVIGANEAYVLQVNLFAVADTNIFIGGVLPDTKIIFYKR